MIEYRMTRPVSLYFFLFFKLQRLFLVVQEGVIFSISGIQNPERGQLRTKGLEMGAQYRPDWSTDCTLLVCAFTDTPKFKQVQANGGSIVSKVSNWSIACKSMIRKS